MACLFPSPFFCRLPTLPCVPFPACLPVILHHSIYITPPHPYLPLETTTVPFADLPLPTPPHGSPAGRRLLPIGREDCHAALPDPCSPPHCSYCLIWTDTVAPFPSLWRRPYLPWACACLLQLPTTPLSQDQIPHLILEEMAEAPMPYSCFAWTACPAIWPRKGGELPCPCPHLPTHSCFYHHTFPHPWVPDLGSSCYTTPQDAHALCLSIVSFGSSLPCVIPCLPYV